VLLLLFPGRGCLCNPLLQCIDLCLVPLLSVCLFPRCLPELCLDFYQFLFHRFLALLHLFLLSDTQALLLENRLIICLGFLELFPHLIHSCSTVALVLAKRVDLRLVLLLQLFAALHCCFVYLLVHNFRLFKPIGNHRHTFVALLNLQEHIVGVLLLF